MQPVAHDNQATAGEFSAVVQIIIISSAAARCIIIIIISSAGVRFFITIIIIISNRSIGRLKIRVLSMWAVDVLVMLDPMSWREVRVLVTQQDAEELSRVLSMHCFPWQATRVRRTYAEAGA